MSLFAAIEVAGGKVTGEPRARHTSDDFVSFLYKVVRPYRKDKEIHIVLDNLSAHKTETVVEWRERHPNVEFHFTPTYS
jgi:transposase